MKIKDAILDKQIAYYKALIKIDNDPVYRSRLFDLEEEHKLDITGYTDCLDEEVISHEIITSGNVVLIYYNEKYVYNPVKNHISVIHEDNQLYDCTRNKKTYY